MVKDEKWSTDLDAPFDFVDEDGKVVKTCNVQLPSQHLPRRIELPVTLYDRLNKSDKRQLKQPSERSAVWPGTVINKK